MKTSRTKIGVIEYIAPDAPITKDTCDDLRNAVDDCISQGEHRIVIDLGRVSFFDSKGLETLLDINTKIRKIGGTLSLNNVNRLCQDIFKATRIDCRIDIYQGEEEKK